VDSEAYWNNRLQAALLLGVIGLAFGVLVNLVGAYLAGSPNRDRQVAGQVVLLVAVLPHLASIVSILAYTPEDWTHIITHVIAVALIAVGLVILRRRSAVN
jgi:ABC-type dipeptide/oligopeptide/nickel transport system permease subunit